MKNMKKIASVVLALVMVFAMASVAFAANITINGGATGAEYAAYKLLNATNSGDNYAYTLNGKYTAVLQEVTGKTTQADIVAYIEGLDAEGIRDFADAVYAQIKAMDPDYTTANDAFTNVDQGYYLIAETKIGADTDEGSDDSVSLVMLDTAGQDDIQVSTKEDVPTVEKKVQDTNDTTGATSGWQDSADYDLGDDVPFQITGTVSAKVADYNTYYYAFHDTLSEGLTYNGDYKVVLDGVDVTNKFVLTQNGQKLDFVCEDLKTAGVELSGDETVVLTYTAELNANSKIGAEGNPNEVYLEYANNPYTNDKGETKVDKVIVFTYEVIVNKTDKDGNALEGAEFTLYKKAADGTWNEVAGTKAGTVFTWSRLDDGDYKLEETKAPDGYNKVDDIEFTISAEHDIESDDPKLTSLSGGNFTANVTAGTLTTDVENRAGSLLPETGGMGTTLFYMLGGLLVVGAAILLVSKKRMAYEA